MRATSDKVVAQFDGGLLIFFYSRAHWFSLSISVSLFSLPLSIFYSYAIRFNYLVSFGIQSNY